MERGKEFSGLQGTHQTSQTRYYCGLTGAKGKLVCRRKRLLNSKKT